MAAPAPAPAPAPASLRHLAQPRDERVLLCVTLACAAKEQGQAQVRALLRSPLGVYVLDLTMHRECIRVRFDIAANDVDFTLHTLISDLPEAMIGPIETRQG
jgi:hypothetical protein